MSARSGDPTPLTILVVTSMHPSSAYPLRGVVVVRLLDALRRLGHRVELIPLGERGGPWRYVQARARVARAIAALQPDVIHVIFGYSGLAVPAGRVPIVTTLCGDDLNGTVGSSGGLTWTSRLGVLVSQWVAWRSGRCIVVSDTLRDRLWSSAVRAKTGVIRDAVDPALFRPLPRQAARARLGLSDDEVLVIFPHDVTQPTKRLWLAEAAVGELRRWVPQARLWVVNGRAPDEMPWHYAAADAMIVTSVREGGPSSVKEALACGVPVVSVPVGDLELFREAPQMMVRAADRPADLGEALRHALSRAPADRRSCLPPGLTLDEAARGVAGVYRDAIAAPRSHVYLACNFWDGLWIIQQPVAQEIARDEPVLYVERFVSLFTVLRYPRLWRRLFTWLRGARRVSDRLRVLAPLPLFHLGHRVPWLFRLEFRLQRWWILWWARGDRSDARVLWMDHPLYECAVGRMGERLAVYHVADEIAAFPTSHPATTEALERSMLRRVGLVFAAAARLADDKRRWNPRTLTVWNAIDRAAFEREPPRDELADVERIPAPRVAFVGVLDRWVDLDLLALAATRLPRMQFLLVGPSHVDDRALRALPNVHFLGRRDRSLVPGILGRCAASVVPFRKTRLTERIVPLKIFEALAAGILPVCTDFSADLAGLERDGYALVARSPEAFVAAVERAVAADTAANRERLGRYGRAQTWRARWEQMRAALDESLTSAPRRSVS